MLERGRYELEIVGTGPDEQRLQDLAKQLGVSREVVFTGSVDRGSIAGRYRDADIFTLASWEEAFGNVFAEALASGLPDRGQHGRRDPRAGGARQERLPGAAAGAVARSPPRSATWPTIPSSAPRWAAGTGPRPKRISPGPGSPPGTSRSITACCAALPRARRSPSCRRAPGEDSVGFWIARGRLAHAPRSPAAARRARGPGAPPPGADAPRRGPDAVLPPTISTPPASATTSSMLETSPEAGARRARARRARPRCARRAATCCSAGKVRPEWRSSSSSGSTGEPFRVYYDPRAWARLKILVKLRARRACGTRPTDRVALLDAVPAVRREQAGSAARVARISILQPAAKVAAQLAAFGPDTDLRPSLRAARGRRPRCATAGQRLAGAAGVHQRRAAPPRGPPGDRAGFGAPVFDVYGSSETKEIAWECPAGGMHVNADVVRLEVLDDAEPGGARRRRRQPRRHAAGEPRDAAAALPDRRPRQPARRALRLRPPVPAARRGDRAPGRRAGARRRPPGVALRAHLRDGAGRRRAPLSGDPARAGPAPGPRHPRSRRGPGPDRRTGSAR